MKVRLGDEPHVLVTGTSGAIGGAIAREIRARAPRARLTLVDRTGDESEKLKASLGGSALVHVVDLAELGRLPELVVRAREVYGPLHGLVNCAGFMEVRRLESFPWELAERLFAVDLLAPLRLQHEILPEMLERGRGFIVNVTSMAGRLPIKGCSMYGAAKAGLAMASEVANAELANRGVHVVTVYPGPVASALERSARAQFGGGRVKDAIPTGNPRQLAQRVLDAVEEGSPRVVYPGLYELGFRAVGLASRATLALGPDPLA
jgi:short-subunit dehydrogenase